MIMMVIIKNTVASVGEDMEKLNHSYFAGGDIK